MADVADDLALEALDTGLQSDHDAAAFLDVVVATQMTLGTPNDSLRIFHAENERRRSPTGLLIPSFGFAPASAS